MAPVNRKIVPLVCYPPSSYINTDSEEPIIDDLERYLRQPQESRVELDILLWWKLRQAEFPHLANMARQFLSLPATSAGPERLFSKAGRMHDALKKCTGEDTLQHALMVAVNL